MSDQIEHQHDWRISPNRYFREGSNRGKEYLLRCPTCTATGWGQEYAEVVEWPKWVGIVNAVELPES